jgi:hypothetical protein
MRHILTERRRRLFRAPWSKYRVQHSKGPGQQRPMYDMPSFKASCIDRPSGKEAGRTPETWSPVLPGPPVVVRSHIPRTRPTENAPHASRTGALAGDLLVLPSSPSNVVIRQAAGALSWTRACFCWGYDRALTGKVFSSSRELARAASSNDRSSEFESDHGSSFRSIPQYKFVHCLASWSRSQHLSGMFAFGSEKMLDATRQPRNNAGDERQARPRPCRSMASHPQDRRRSSSTFGGNGSGRRSAEVRQAWVYVATCPEAFPRHPPRVARELQAEH